MSISAFLERGFQDVACHVSCLAVSWVPRWMFEPWVSSVPHTLGDVHVGGECGVRVRFVFAWFYSTFFSHDLFAWGGLGFNGSVLSWPIVAWEKADELRDSL